MRVGELRNSWAGAGEITDSSTMAEERKGDVYANAIVSGGLDEGDNDYTNGIMFRRLPPVPMRVNTGPTESGKGDSCFQKNWSRTSKVSLLVLMALLCILLIIVGALFSAAIVQAEGGKQSNTTIPVNEMQSLRHNPEEWKETSTPVPKKNICPPMWNRIGDSCYSFSSIEEKWLNAVASCNRQQSKLLLLTSRVEMDSLRPFMNGGGFWIGLKKFLSIWMWLDGTTLTYSNWQPNEPNNHNGNELCVEMKPEGWNDLDCDRKMKYICKK